EARGGRLELRVEATDTKPDERRLDPSDNPAPLPHEPPTPPAPPPSPPPPHERPPPPARPLGILLSKRRLRDHLAMSALPAQPAEKAALEKLRVEPIGLRPAMFARYRNARCMNDVALAPLRGKPACQPEAVVSGLERHGDA